MKRIFAAFYRMPYGKEPVHDWLIALPKPDRIIVGQDIATVEFGWPIGMPVCRSLRHGLFEVRSTIRNGKIEVRTYFAIEGDMMLLLHGQVGKSEQQAAIELARKRLKDHHARIGETK